MSMPAELYVVKSGVISTSWTSFEKRLVISIELAQGNTAPGEPPDIAFAFGLSLVGTCGQ